MSEEAGETQRTGGWKGHRTSRTRMEPDKARRQGDIVTLAYTLLGGRDAAVAFLNSTCEPLEARPIDLAMQSDLGFLRVETLLRKLSGKPLGA